MLRNLNPYKMVLEAANIRSIDPGLVWSRELYTRITLFLQLIQLIYLACQRIAETNLNIYEYFFFSS